MTIYRGTLNLAASECKFTLVRDKSSGRDATILALLAQRGLEQMTEEDKDRILSELTGIALKVGEVLVGRAKNPSRAALKTAADFRDWAENL